jgi:hypothetical protein
MAWLHVPPAALRASSPAEECSTPESAWPAELSLWCTSSEGHTPRPSSWPGWRKRPWVALLSGTTSPPSTLERGVAWWISSLAAAPAKTSPSPESGLALLAHEAASGSTNSASLRRQGLLFSSGKTSEEQSGPRSTWLRTTLSASATELRLALSALQMSEPPTTESDSSSWPTPSAKPYGSSQNGINSTRPSAGTPSLWTTARTWPTPTGRDRSASGSRCKGEDTTGNPGTSLTDAAVRQWPTPAARDRKGSNGPEHLAKDRGHHDQLPNAVAMWATPMRPSGGRTLTREEVEAKGKTAKGKRQVDLRAQVMHWATPRASDGTKGGPNARDGSGSLHLSAMAVQHSEPIASPQDATPPSGHTGMALNPEFVEALMGLPRRWSSARIASSCSATESCPNKLPPPSLSAGSDSSEVGE